MPLAMAARKIAASTDIVRKCRDAFVGPPLHSRFASNNGEIIRAAIRIAHPSRKDGGPSSNSRCGGNTSGQVDQIRATRLAWVPGCI